METPTSSVRPAEISQRLLGVVMIAISLGYLSFFVSRGWVPHDEGMVGQSAERVLRGDTPHVDYEEPYTGGLTWLYAAIFKFGGVDLLKLRWLLFAGAALAQVLTYAILRRYFSPSGAALTAWLALAWSFPNFFAGLPSWWVLVCALGCLWAFIRYVETGRLVYATAAGLTAGFAIMVKQTGIYLLVALVMSFLCEDGVANHGPAPSARVERFLRVGVALAALLLAVAILGSRLLLSELLYLLLPIAACSCLLLMAGGRTQTSRSRRGGAAMATAVAFAGVPFALFLVPYVIHHQLGSLFQGLLILPQKRLVFAVADLPSAGFILTGIPLVALVTTCPRVFESSRLRGRLLGAAIWIVALALLVGSLYNRLSYQIIWQSARAFAALLPIAICWRLIAGHIHDPDQRRILFSVASMLAWASLVQFPFSAPIYFCYVAPLAIVAGSAAAGSCPRLARSAIGAWVALLLVFAVVSMNRGYIYNLGQFHAPQALNVDLDLPRAHLRVSASDALTYRRLVALIGRHVGDGRLIAGPDCPEVYFLTGRVNPSGALFDFFSSDEPGAHGITNAADWGDASVVVLNHQAAFSPGPSPDLIAEIRHMFSEGESVGRFEVRWR